ncbi:hypothetical protein C8R44DRAFT_803695 [Mycena epipterygia]|nr:hypothetical protein C8R44DRAFT_803695 [Mycena epipterygia]
MDMSTPFVQTPSIHRLFLPWKTGRIPSPHSWIFSTIKMRSWLDEIAPSSMITRETR